MAEKKEERTYTSGEICRVIGLPRSTFDAWLLRHYLPLPPGPGTGRLRRYTLLDAVRICVANELTKYGFAIKAAGRISNDIHDPFADPDPITGRDQSHRLLILADTKPIREGETDERIPSIFMGPMASLNEVRRHLQLRFVGGTPATFTIVDVTALANRTRAALEDPDSPVPRLVTWLDFEDSDALIDDL